MKQKLGLACALLGRPRLLLLDEPGVGVDPLSRRELWRMVSELVASGVTVLWSTAYLEEAERCAHIWLLDNGRLLYDGAPARLSERVRGRVFRRRVAPGAAGGGSSAAADRVLVRAEALTRRFGDFVAADTIGFEVRAGEIYGLLGPNGAGKSTTFRMLCGLLMPTSGEASVAGVNLARAASRARARLGYMAQKFSLYGDLSVAQNLDYFADIYGLTRSAKRERVQALIDMVALAPHLPSNAALLPLGFKQRLALACATLHAPAVLFLDEPTSGVDPLMRREF